MISKAPEKSHMGEGGGCHPGHGLAFPSVVGNQLLVHCHQDYFDLM